MMDVPWFAAPFLQGDNGQFGAVVVPEFAAGARAAHAAAAVGIANVQLPVVLDGAGIRQGGPLV